MVIDGSGGTININPIDGDIVISDVRYPRWMMFKSFLAGRLSFGIPAELVFHLNDELVNLSVKRKR